MKILFWVGLYLAATVTANFLSCNYLLTQATMKYTSQLFTHSTFLYSYWIGLHVHFKKAILHLKRATIPFLLSVCVRTYVWLNRPRKPNFAQISNEQLFEYTQMDRENRKTALFRCEMAFLKWTWRPIQ